MEKVRRKVTGGEEREECEEKGREDVRGKIEKYNAVFPLVYRIKLTLPAVAPQAQTYHMTIFLNALCKTSSLLV